MPRAEDKYELQTVQTKTDKPLQHQPWYRERFRSQHLKDLPGDRSYPHLVGSEWTFVKDGLDDFRDGYPPEPEGGGIIKPMNGVAPQLQSYHRTPKQQVKPSLNKHQVLYSKTLPGQERRRDYLDSLINGLKDHPLALYSHIEESVPADMFEDLIDALDKEMMLGGSVTDEEYNNAQQQPRFHYQSQTYVPPNPGHDEEAASEPEVASNNGGGEGTRDAAAAAPRGQGELFQSGVQSADSGRSSENKSHIDPDQTGNIDLMVKGDKEKLKQAEDRLKIANEVYDWPSISKAKDLWKNAEPVDLLSRQSLDEGIGGTSSQIQDSQNGYRWMASGNMSKQQQHQQQHSARGQSAGAALTPAEDAHIQSVTTGFCQWVAELGGDSNNIDESTVMGLFSGGYESKPALSVPIHVVELTNVPPELRMNSAAPGQSRMSSASAPEGDSKLLNAGYVHTKPTKAVRYGAWYLKPKQWKALKPGEDITDPNLKQGEFSEAKRRSVALDGELANMHGAKEFIKFMRHKGNSVPDFLSRVAALQQDESEEKGPSGAKLPPSRARSAAAPTPTGMPSK